MYVCYKNYEISFFLFMNKLQQKLTRLAKVQVRLGNMVYTRNVVIG